MHHTFKELKIGNSNEEALNTVTLQNEDVLTLFKKLYEHAMYNVLKQCQSLINRATNPSNTLSLTSFHYEVDTFAFISHCNNSGPNVLPTPL
jgi:hypothetical protein